MPTLPLHGLRRSGRISGEGFLSFDHLDGVHALAQSIWDIRRILDPVAQLIAIHETTRVAKQVHHALGAEMLADWSELTPPRPFAAWMRFYSRHKLADRHRPPINLVISNVPGPTVPLYIAGARLEALYSMGPVLEGISLNITMWSYLGVLYFGLVACREAMGDLWDLCIDLAAGLEELTSAARLGP